ncbi:MULTISPECIES: intermembrane transport protein PqiB [Paraburkholderia]|uniref:MCE family protein n=5 Tax=Paraburkholderia hospita TaxID=169430 RepID=A0AAJ5BA21_9BURK|nr:MlaD family protein [Paraburkholderia hospita]SKC92057.1 paraquat-inducible protein B [Burkholderia sp. CF099]SOE86616.1 paraquat-inducible protein B [Burkholderia sp. YR290]AUT71900.1 MCE family protein [Paraburkholderia hospita]AXF02846.1 MCE family protein [Paraburkholderia hospita]SEI25714.1 paraquat-inducible protein B [Paraburkholderia hospita]
MAKPPGQSGSPDVPEAVATPRSRWRVQIVWLVPLIAILIGGWLAVKAVMEQGPTVTIGFETGEGLEAGKTKIKFKNVDIGVVKNVKLSGDHRRVIATAELSKDATNLLIEDTRFWVVRPRISGGTVSGIGTLLSGSFIGMDVGTSTKPRRDYTGLETPPVFAIGVPGREFILKGADMGSLDVGSPIFYRRLQVGQVISYQLDPDGKGVTMHVFVNAPYDRYVKPDTRFWQASGIDVSLDTTGVKVNTESLVAILIGGLAFQTPDETPDDAEAAANTEFALFNDRAEAFKRHDRIVDHYVLVFRESVRGLVVGAPVDFLGIVVGEVAAINTGFDPVTKRFSIPVEIRLYPERFTSRFVKGGAGGRITNDRERLAQTLVDHGLRAQLRTGNLLTGQLYVALDFFPNAPKAKVDWTTTPPEMPTIPGGLQSMQDSVTSLLAKLNQIPFGGIGKGAQKTLADADTLLKQLRTDVVPQARDTLAAAQTALNSANGALQPDAPLAQNTADAMSELARTAAAFRSLADYLERHPEALIRGKPEDNK